MKKVYDLTSDDWRKDFEYAYGPQAKTEAVFTERSADGAITNTHNGTDFDYICALSEKEYTSGVRASARCRFYGSGAPLIVFSDDFTKRKSGATEFALHFEVVAHAGGCNVWRIVPRPETPAWPVASTMIFSESFKINDGEEIDLSLEVTGKALDIYMSGRHFRVTDEKLPQKFRVGFTACEGKCEFLEFSIEELPDK